MPRTEFCLAGCLARLQIYTSLGIDRHWSRLRPSSRVAGRVGRNIERVRAWNGGHGGIPARYWTALWTRTEVWRLLSPGLRF